MTTLDATPQLCKVCCVRLPTSRYADGACADCIGLFRHHSPEDPCTVPGCKPFAPPTANQNQEESVQSPSGLDRFLASTLEAGKVIGYTQAIIEVVDLLQSGAQLSVVSLLELHKNATGRTN